MSRLLRTVTSLISLPSRLNSITNRFPGRLIFSGGFPPVYLTFSIQWSDVSDPSDSELMGDPNDEIIPGEEYKMVLCVRMDLKMGKGKMCAQCGHAAVGAVRTASMRVPNQLRRWERYGQPKIALKVIHQTPDLLENQVIRCRRKMKWTF